jgi:4-amino-4-deoxychorismate lyase
MSLYIESISIESDRTCPLISYHQARIDRTIGKNHDINLESIVQSEIKELTESIQQKLRILYDQTGVKEAKVQPYQVKLIRNLRAVDIAFDYDQKSADRDAINTVYARRGESDDILMVKDGLITDTSYGNVACYKDGIWYTPESPLLGGCRRQSLIDDGLVAPKKIRIEALDSYPYLMLFNGLIPFGRVIIPTDRIVLSD